MPRDKGSNLSEISDAVISKVLPTKNLNYIAPEFTLNVLLSYHGYLFYQKRVLLLFWNFLLSIISDAGL